MRARTWARTATGAVAIVMATTAVAWACGREVVVPGVVGYSAGTAIEMSATNDGTGKSETVCPADTHTNPGAPLGPHICTQQSVTVMGTNFVNGISLETVTAVGLYWVDAPFGFQGLPHPDGAVERTEANICMNKGVHLATATVTSGAFSHAIPTSFPAKAIPPKATTSSDGTDRFGKFWYGANAICAVWEHSSLGITHYGSAGTFYRIVPADSPLP
ncbi:MAG TPA: hypothetical protein VM142_10565 [Acidimicrobiales bacterium]|nr:hypothetical protein [Acidimicrobiales bacterium]